MKKSILAIVVLAMCMAAAQDKSAAQPDAPTPTVAAKPEVVKFIGDEHGRLRDLQVAKMNAYAALVAANEAYQQADKEMQEGVQKVYAAHGLDTQRDPLCDGPVGAECADVKKGDLVAKKMPTQQAKK
jgi:hypothetical protein